MYLETGGPFLSDVTSPLVVLHILSLTIKLFSIDGSREGTFSPPWSHCGQILFLVRYIASASPSNICAGNRSSLEFLTGLNLLVAAVTSHELLVELKFRLMFSLQ